ncbi:MAG: hypothetical protein A2Z72_00420 [Omnitrophica bacterium RBG_13_46_9]|nr:MAG: hypothetical protein A2Z72_00420 [Omnitrophica bacterium RBG_13_46_9]
MNTVSWSSESGAIPTARPVQEIDIAGFEVPVTFGTVDTRYQGTNGKTIIHIQDAHCNYGCQRSIENLVSFLNAEYGIDTVALEGGAGDYDLSVFTDINDRSLREKVADYFVQEGRINGAEFFAIRNPEKVTLKGLENTDLYIKNLNVYQEGLAYKNEVDEILRVLNHYLSNLKDHIYSRELKELEKNTKEYAGREITLAQYLEYLSDRSAELVLDISREKNLKKLITIIEDEKGIDFEQANTERKQLIDMLAKRLSALEMETFVKKSLLFKEDRIKETDFYSYLFKKSGTTDIDITGAYPNLAAYKKYVDAYGSIDTWVLFSELERLEDMIAEKLATNDTQKRLYRLSKSLVLIEDLFAISLEPERYALYEKEKDDLAVCHFLSFIEAEAPRYGIRTHIPDDVATLDRHRERMERFYEYTFERDIAFEKNIASYVKREPAILVITGGFHAENLRKLFKDKGYSYVAILPDFKNGKGYACPYYRLLSGGLLREEEAIRTALSAMALQSMFSDMKTSPGSEDITRLAVVLRRAAEEGRPLILEKKDRNGRPIQRTIFTRDAGGEYRRTDINAPESSLDLERTAQAAEAIEITLSEDNTVLAMRELTSEFVNSSILAIALFEHGGPLNIHHSITSIASPIWGLQLDACPEVLITDRMRALDEAKIRQLVTTYDHFSERAQSINDKTAENRREMGEIAKMREEYLAYLADMERLIKEYLSAFSPLRDKLDEKDEYRENLEYGILHAERMLFNIRVLRLVLRPDISDALETIDIGKWFSAPERKWMTKVKGAPAELPEVKPDRSVEHVPLFMAHPELLHMALERVISNGFHVAMENKDKVPAELNNISIKASSVLDGTRVRIIVSTPGHVAEKELKVNPRSNMRELFTLDYARSEFSHGIGMPFASLAVRKMGGTIDVRNVGTEAAPRVEFIVEFPAADSEAEPEAERDSSKTGGAWWGNRVYMRWFSWWVEPVVAFGVGGIAAHYLSLNGINVAWAAVVAGLVFWLPHVFRGREVFFSRDVVGLSIGTFLTGLSLYSGGLSSLTLGALGLMTFAHIHISSSASKEAYQAGKRQSTGTPEISVPVARGSHDSPIVQWGNPGEPFDTGEAQKGGFLADGETILGDGSKIITHYAGEDFEMHLIDHEKRTIKLQDFGVVATNSTYRLSPGFRTLSGCVMVIVQGFVDGEPHAYAAMHISYHSVFETMKLWLAGEKRAVREHPGLKVPTDEDYQIQRGINMLKTLLPKRGRVTYKAMVLGADREDVNLFKNGLEKIWHIDVPEGYAFFYQKQKDHDKAVAFLYDGARTCHVQCLDDISKDESNPKYVISEVHTLSWTKRESAKGDLTQKEPAAGDSKSLLKPTDSSDTNVTCGTVCEKSHRTCLNALNSQIEAFYGELKRESGITREFLTSDEVIEALGRRGYDTALLQRIRAHIQEKIPGITKDKVQILFAIPPQNQRLWWVQNPDTRDWEYAGGHFGGSIEAGTARIHISLPLVLSEYHFLESALAIAEHDYKHLKGTEVKHVKEDKGFAEVESISTFDRVEAKKICDTRADELAKKSEIAMIDASFLRDVALRERDPDKAGAAVKAMEDFVKIPSTKYRSDIYSFPVYELAMVFERRPGLITGNTIDALKGFFLASGSVTCESDIYERAARIFRTIIEKRPEYAEMALFAIEEICTAKGLSVHAYRTPVSVLGGLMRDGVRKDEEIFAIMEKIATTKGQEGFVYDAVFLHLREVCEARGKLSAGVLDIYKNIFTTEGLGDAYIVARSHLLTLGNMLPGSRREIIHLVARVAGLPAADTTALSESRALLRESLYLECSREGKMLTEEYVRPYGLTLEGDFPYLVKMEEILKYTHVGERKRLLVLYDYERGGVGDEIICIEMLVQAIINKFPGLDVTVYTRDNTFLYEENQKIHVRDVRSLSVSTIEENYDMVISNIPDRVSCPSAKIRVDVKPVFSMVLDIDGMERVNIDSHTDIFDIGGEYMRVFKLCSYLGIPADQLMGRHARKTLLIGSGNRIAEKWWDENVLPANTDGRTIVLFNPFGGESERKGFNTLEAPDMKGLIDFLHRFIECGTFIAILPNNTWWGNYEQAEKIRKQLAEAYPGDEKYIMLLPQPDHQVIEGERVSKLVKYWINRADHVLTVEGAIMHFACALQRPFTVMRIKGGPQYSGPEWYPPVLADNQMIIEDWWNVEKIIASIKGKTEKMPPASDGLSTKELRKFAQDPKTTPEALVEYLSDGLWHQIDVIRDALRQEKYRSKLTQFETILMEKKDRLILSIAIMEHGGPLDFLESLQQIRSSFWGINGGLVPKSLITERISNLNEDDLGRFQAIYAGYTREAKIVNDTYKMITEETAAGIEDVTDRYIIFLKEVEKVLNSYCDAFGEIYDKLEEKSFIKANIRKNLSYARRMLFNIRVISLFLHAGDAQGTVKPLRFKEWLDSPDRTWQTKVKLAPGKRLNVDVDADLDKDLHILANSELLHMALERIISNGFHVARANMGKVPDDHNKITIKAVLSEDGGKARIIVSTPGNIEESNLNINSRIGLPELFTLDYYRPEFHHGVGLPFTAQAVKIMNGSISVLNIRDTDYPRVEFIIELPAASEKNVEKIIKSTGTSLTPDYVVRASEEMLTTLTTAPVMNQPCTIGMVVKASPRASITEEWLRDKFAKEMEILGRKVNTHILKEKGILEYEQDNIKYVVYVDNGTTSEKNRKRLEGFKERLAAQGNPKERTFAWVLSSDETRPHMESIGLHDVAYLVGLRGEYIPVSWQMLAGPLFANLVDSKSRVETNEEERVGAIVEAIIDTVSKMTRKDRNELDNTLGKTLRAADMTALTELFNGISLILDLPDIVPVTGGLETYQKADEKIRASL